MQHTCVCSHAHVMHWLHSAWDQVFTTCDCRTMCAFVLGWSNSWLLLMLTMIPAPTSENAPAQRKCQWHFPQFVFFFFNSSSPIAVTHECWEEWIWFIHRTAWLLTHCLLLLIREQRCSHVCKWQISSFFVCRLWARHHLQWHHFLQMTVYLTISSRRSVLSVWNVAYLGSAAGLPCYGAQSGIGT